MKVDLSHGGLVRLAVTVVAVAMVLYHMWVIVAGQPEAIIFRGTHLMFALVLTFLIYGSKVGVQRRIPNYSIMRGWRSASLRCSTCSSITNTSSLASIISMI